MALTKNVEVYSRCTSCNSSSSARFFSKSEFNIFVILELEAFHFVQFNNFFACEQIPFSCI